MVQLLRVWVKIIKVFVKIFKVLVKLLNIFITRIKWFPLAVKSVFVDKLFFFDDKISFCETGRCERRWVDTSDRRWRCGGWRRRETPTMAGSGATAARCAYPPSLTAASFHKISFYKAKYRILLSKNDFTQPTEIPLFLCYDVFVPKLIVIDDPPNWFGYI